MNAIDAIADAARRTGYREEAILRDYAFADVLDPANPTRTVALAAFTRTPPSYRSAAFAAVPAGHHYPSELAKAHRSLGAPLLFVIEDEQISLWQVRGDAPPLVRERLSVDAVPALFQQHQDEWRPDAIHRAKAIGAVDKDYQLDFVDIGLMPAVEGEVHLKLHRLLNETLDAASRASRVDSERLFRAVFRLLAAKVLQDRRHAYARGWDAADLASVLRAIESYYSLPAVLGTGPQTMSSAFLAAWECLQGGINFSNISSDDLAFVYENTLVTPTTRRRFGTHSTPRQLAEYAVARLELHRHEPEDLDIYEPFAGAGAFLISALRHVRDLLPADWRDQERHAFLVDRLAGDEIDLFAREVALLSLVLADYPNQNGWRVREADLFEDGVLQSRMRKANVVLCNPPFEDFSDDERARYAMATEFYSKPKAALNAALDAHPRSLAFVMPRPFILHQKFAPERRRIEALYGDVELVALPDRTFAVSKIESALLVARDPRPPATAAIAVRSTEVADRDRNAFLKTGRTTTERRLERMVGDSPKGELWIAPLPDLWRYLKRNPRLGNYFAIHWGIQWKSAQSDAWNSDPRDGYRRGLHTARGARQFALQNPVYLDCRRESLRHNAIDLPWDRHKLVVNGARLTRRSWRIAAVLDRSGLVCSQQFVGLWPKRPVSDAELLAFVAILNGPVANGFLATHSPAERIRIEDMKNLPIPPALPSHVAELVINYGRLLQDLTKTGSEDEMEEVLTRIDAAVLDAYDLPARLERQLLDYFRDSDRPVAHAWRHWDERIPAPGLTLAERVSGRFRPHGAWILDVFKPLPADEANLLRDYGV